MAHLTEVFEGDLIDCFLQWLLKSTTAFHEHENLNLPWYFGLFCWNYALAGVVLLNCRPTWIGRTDFPYTAFAWVLILMQAPLSFYADYLYMDQDSILHVLDRCLAIPCFVLELSKISLVWRHGRAAPTAIGNTLLVFLATGAFVMSQRAQSTEDREAFILWHNLWHLYPLLTAILTIYDFAILGRFEQPPLPSEASSTSLPVLLSSLLMMESTRREHHSGKTNAKASKKKVV